MDRLPFGRWFGVPVFIEPFALVVLAFYALRDADSGGQALLHGTLLGLGVFASILVHELGHALAARFFKLHPLEIVLHGFGGLTRYALAARPWPGIFTTFAGPAAGLLLGVILLFVPNSVPVVGSLAVFNLFWSLVNLLPLFPLDGGHILAHGLALFMPEVRAYTWAARIAVPLWAAVGIWAVASLQIFVILIVFMSLQQVVPLAFNNWTKRPPRR
jgi:stage IV sporulation protein FB